MRGEVLGIGWVTAGGLGRGRQQSPFALSAGALPAIARQDVFTEPDMRFGRLDPFSRTGLAAIALALQDAGLDRWSDKRPYALVAGSTCGCLATDSDYFDTVLPQGGELASPQLFVYTLPNCFLGEAAIRFGLTGPAWVATAGEPDGLEPLRLALETIAWGEAQVVVAGVCDLPRPPLLDPAAGETPGAVFLVISRPGAGVGKSLGEIGMEAGRMTTSGKIITSLEELVTILRKI